MVVMVSQKERKGEFIRTWSSISAGEVSSLLVQNQLRDKSPVAGIYKHPSLPLTVSTIAAQRQDRRLRTRRNALGADKIQLDATPEMRRLYFS